MHVARLRRGILGGGRKLLLITLGVAVSAVGIYLFAVPLSAPPTTFAAGTPIKAGEVNGNFATLYNNDASLNGQLFWGAITGGIGYSGGNVGIGTALPPSLLAVVSDAQPSVLYLSSVNAQKTGAHIVNTSPGGRDWAFIVTGEQNSAGAGKLILHDATALMNRMTWDSAGNVGIGSTSPACKLDVSGDIRANAPSGNVSLWLTQAGTNAGRIAGANSSDVALYSNRAIMLFPNNTYTLIGPTGGLDIGFDTLNMYSIPAKGLVVAGNVGIATSAPAYTLDVNGTAHCTAGAWSSDLRYKKDLEPLAGALDRLERLEGRSFRWRVGEVEGRNLPTGIHYGLVAQEVEKTMPEIVDSAGGEKSIAYIELIPILIEGMKELRAEKDREIAELRAAIEDLAAENRDLRRRIVSP